MAHPVEPCVSGVRVAIATRNKIKVRAVEKVFKRFCNVTNIIAVTPPQLPQQPSGAIEVFRGALTRAKVARKYGDFGVGVEAGPIEFYTSTGFIETQVAVIVGPSNKVSVGLSPSFELPHPVLDKILKGLELADAVNVPRSGDIGEQIGYIGYVTSGFITRQDLTVHALVMALVPWIAGFDSELMSVDEISEMLGYDRVEH
ncbi:MAG: inosine/xanthosine triphosphatase [Desulfurococcales archaeon]|nr:inosine/xanthosine triphosphatase [Desulfurococcales archaeon]